MNKVSAHRSLTTLGIWLSTKCASFFKLTMVLGSSHAFLSGASMISPLIGLYGGIAGSSFIWAISFMLRTLVYGFSSLSLLAFYIPGWCAALYFASRHWFIRLIVPLACIAAFIAHPIGNQAWIYSMYWLIPVALYALQRTHIVYQALGATFTAHAVGSVIWLYTIGMTPIQWLSLIPVVACERLAYTAGIVAMYYTVQYIQVLVAKRHAMQLPIKAHHVS